jgi:two-component system sensor histidine kinase KdpD
MSNFNIKEAFKNKTKLGTMDVLKSFVILTAATGIGFIFESLNINAYNIIDVYIFGVLVISIITYSNYMCGIVSSLVSVLTFNFFFTVPKYTLKIYNSGYFITFVIMFIAAVLSASLAAKLRENARQASIAERKTKILLSINRLLQRQSDVRSVTDAVAGELSKLLKRDVAVYLVDANDSTKLQEPVIYRSEDSTGGDLTADVERHTAEWTFRNKACAGATTHKYPEAECLYNVIALGSHVYGVVGIKADGGDTDYFEDDMLMSLLGECAMAIESIKNSREKEEAAVLAKNEQLRANLLSTISHDLRTPLTSISGSAGNLLANYKNMDDEDRVQTFTDIYNDSMWLINLVENILSITRIKSGKLGVELSLELVDDVMDEAMRHIDRQKSEHIIKVTEEDKFILARMDPRLIVQVIINLVNNAIKYTPKGSVIEIHTAKKDDMVEISVTDNGPGIPDEQKNSVFEMFYSGSRKVADSRRSMGLGLALCRSIVTAHGGTIRVEDNVPHGAKFIFTLQAGEVENYEQELDTGY